MRWKKLGNIFCPSGNVPLLCSHAANPLAVHVEKNIFRIYFSGRDIHNKSSVGFLDYDIVLHKVIQQCTAPVFTYGAANTFYSHGVSIGNMYSAANKNYILFMGWQMPENKHWRGDIGRIEMNGKSEFSLNPNSPFMGIDSECGMVQLFRGVQKMAKWFM